MKLHLPRSYHNMLSYVGTAVAIISLFMFIFLYVLASLANVEQGYIGLVIFIVIPIFIIIGLVLIPLGMILFMRTEKKHGAIPEKQLPVLNLNIPQHRNATVIFVIGTIFFLFLSALGSYKAYHYTESTEFCGTLCHDLMIPEYTAYQLSPHARVSCAGCHVGEGANWYVKSKLSGLYQVYATVANKYPKPIPTPIENLRPARETCEECHWPEKVYGKQQRREIYFLPNEENTRWEINMLLNTGGGNPALGHSSGIHWHINPNIEIQYITTDKERSEIPRVILINKKTGEQIIYNDQDAPFNESDSGFVEKRTMDCIDCHNRPSHIYRGPNRFINIAIASGKIDSTLPMIKQVAVESCLDEFESTEAAHHAIEENVFSFYQDNYPEIAEQRKQAIAQSITGIQHAFSNNIFPEMKVRWTHYPDHIGHMHNKGCYRCHDDNHISDDGDMIEDTCDDCHVITAQGKSGEMEYAGSAEALEFKHPVDIGEAWKVAGCFECHEVPPI